MEFETGRDDAIQQLENLLFSFRRGEPVKFIITSLTGHGDFMSFACTDSSDLNLIERMAITQFCQVTCDRTVMKMMGDPHIKLVK